MLKPRGEASKGGLILGNWLSRECVVTRLEQLAGPSKNRPRVRGVEPVLEAIDVWKVYRQGARKVTALRGVNLKIERGTITTLLGKNGAGKTTFLRIAATQLLPTKGTVRVFGFDVVREPWPIRERIAVIPQDAKPLLFPSPYEYVKTIQVMRGCGFGEAHRRTVEALEEMEIPREVWNRSLWSLSGGMRRRVLLAAVLAADADLVFLDEPSIGLDPIARRRLWSKIAKLREHGKTVLLTTHYMEEAEVLSDKVVLVHKGRVYLEGEPLQLVKSLLWKFKIEVTSACTLDGLSEAGEIADTGPPYYIYARDSEQASSIMETLTKRGCRAVVAPVSLEDVFLLSVREKEGYRDL